MHKNPQHKQSFYQKWKFFSTQAEANIASTSTAAEVMELDYIVPSDIDIAGIALDMNLMNIKEQGIWRRMTAREMLHYYMMEKFNQELEERERRWEEEDEGDNNSNIEGREGL